MSGRLWLIHCPERRAAAWKELHDPSPALSRGRAHPSAARAAHPAPAAGAAAGPAHPGMAGRGGDRGPVLRAGGRGLLERPHRLPAGFLRRHRGLAAGGGFHRLRGDPRDRGDHRAAGDGRADARHRHRRHRGARRPRHGHRRDLPADPLRGRPGRAGVRPAGFRRRPRRGHRTDRRGARRGPARRAHRPCHRSGGILGRSRGGLRGHRRAAAGGRARRRAGDPADRLPLPAAAPDRAVDEHVRAVRGAADDLAPGRCGRAAAVRADPGHPVHPRDRCDHRLFPAVRGPVPR